MEKQSLKYRLLADLLATLEAEEFPIGVGKHLDLQQLISKIPEDTSPKDMKTLLAPIFAKNKQDQAFFYDLFDQSLKRAKAKTWQPTQEKTPPPPPADKFAWWIKLIGSVLLFSILLGIFLIAKNDDPILMPEPLRELLAVESDTSYQISINQFYPRKDTLGKTVISDTSSLLYVSFLDGQNLVADSLFGTYQVDSLGNFTLTTIDSIREVPAEITIIANYPIGFDTIILKPWVLNNFNDSIPIPTYADLKAPDTLALLSHPFPKSLNNLFPTPPPAWKVFFNKYYLPIKVFLIFLLITLFGLWYRWWQERNQQVIADIQSKTDPPLLWNIEIPNVTRLSLNEKYFKVLQQMRARTSDDHFVLNIPKTINKTIQQAGMVEFQYQYKTRPPEYLLLIDRQSSKNHRAHLYDYLYHNFKENEVYIERFFYEGDIRLCWNEYYPNGIKLADLQQTFHESRLIIIGSGYQMLNPLTGKLAKWTRFFDTWANKAILSPRPTQSWGGREKQLKEKFILLPASMESLSIMVDKMEAIDPEEIKTKISDQHNEPIEFRGDLMETLHHYFSIKKEGKIVNDRIVQWIAACAIYPTLHWDLTMFLGQELSDEDNDLMTVDNVLQLTRLPWFVEGKIPEQARMELLEYLPNDTEMHLRNSLQELFDVANLPDKNSVAYSDTRMNIALNEYLLKKDPRLKQEYEQYLRAGTEADVTMLRYLEGEKSPQDFEVDSSWRKYAQGEPADIKPDRLTKILAFGVIGLILGLLFYFPSHEGCPGELVELGELELCIKTPSDQLIYREFQIRNQINKDLDTVKVDSLEALSIVEYYASVNKDSIIGEIGSIVEDFKDGDRSIIALLASEDPVIHFYKNLAVDFFNHGAPIYNEYLSLEEQIGRKDSLEILKDQFCNVFQLASFYDGQNSYGDVTFELNPIRSRHCLESFVDSTYYLDGFVFNQIGSKAIDNVNVQFLSTSKKSNENGFYGTTIPGSLIQDEFKITFSKSGFKTYVQTILKSQFQESTIENQKSLSLPGVYLEPTGTTTEQNPEPDPLVSCKTATKLLNGARLNLRSLQDQQFRRRVAIAYKIIKDYPSCDRNSDLWEKEKQGFFKDMESRGYYLDQRDGQVYKTVKIGNQTWFAENLNYKVSTSVCYDNDPRNCEEYGQLYSANSIPKLCDNGWRVPSDTDFKYLIKKVNGWYTISESDVDEFDFKTPKNEIKRGYDALKIGGASGFNWEYGGFGESTSSFEGIQELGVLISSTSENINIAKDTWAYVMVDEKVDLSNYTDNLLTRLPMPINGKARASCRCVKGPNPNPAQFQREEQNTTPEISLNIELRDELFNTGLTGYTLEFEKDKANKIDKTDRSGYRFSAKVNEGQTYTILAKKDGVEKARLTISAQAEPKKKSQNITIKVGNSTFGNEPEVDHGFEYVRPQLYEGVSKRNKMSIRVNTASEVLYRGEPERIIYLKDNLKKYISNPSKRPDYSESPEKATIQLAIEEGTSAQFIKEIMDQIESAYLELRDEESYRVFGKNYEAITTAQKKTIKEKYPFQVSRSTIIR